jgi:Holliday junction resolvase RusA-like endonuclease
VTDRLDRLRAAFALLEDEGSELADLLRGLIRDEERAQPAPDWPQIGQEWSFEVPGAAVPQGSLKYLGQRKTASGKSIPILVADNPALKAWRDDVGTMANGAHIEPAGKGQPIEIEVIFRRPRAASNHGTYPVMPPDLDKLVRAVLDALKGIAYVDDGQVCRIVASKEYGPARAEITVRWLGGLL